MHGGWRHGAQARVGEVAPIVAGGGATGCTILTL
jgi:hypothetical protein